MRRGLVCVLLAIWPSVSLAADPLTLLLLRFMRDKIISSAIESAVEQAQRSEPARPLIIPRAPYDLNDRELKALIDEGFVHLSDAQREEVYASVKRMLADPKNAALRPLLVQELAVKASAVRQAHEQLAGLSPERKKTIATEAREEYEKLPPEERQQMIEVLRSGVVPIPRDLNDMILAEFSSVSAAVGRRSE
jgi:pyruvate-formate lyase-activating enzyme